MASQRESSWVLLSQDANKRLSGAIRRQANLNIGELFKRSRDDIRAARHRASGLRLGGASLNRPRTRRRPRPRVGRVGWRRFCGQVSGEVFVPKGRNDSSLAVYCLGCGKKPNRPVRERYDWVGGTFCDLEW